MNNPKPRKSAAQRDLDFQRRMVIASVIGVALGFAGALYGVAYGQVAPRDAGWRIVQYYKGNAFVIDHGLTHDDCDDMLPRNQAAKGLTFACELGA